MASYRSQSIGATLWHGLCNMGIVFTCFFHAQSLRLSLPHVNGDMRPAHHVPPPAKPGTPVHPLTNALIHAAANFASFFLFRRPSINESTFWRIDW